MMGLSRKIASEFRFIQSVNGKNNYALISFEGEVTPRLDKSTQGVLRLDFLMPAEHDPAAQVGAVYFFDHYTAEHPVDLCLRFSRVHSMLVDTSVATVLYATVMALSEAFAFSIEGFTLDAQTGVLSMPFSKHVRWPPFA
ncbi:hypothetical protein [Hymenobacter perfusus]|uniref:Uncharacterized protein n=1 Tax=Hymenobacter perfusus TaxID=1236770 RepID=A0A3R9M6M1_9BACT|nr:hypothetical protein [Hymenobacter perfusus]RSK38431.1 hypothetical protein EI293_21675 [Hymenobacter perfusus]